MNCIKRNLKEFLENDHLNLVEELKAYIESYDLKVSDSQVRAWVDCLNFMKRNKSKIPKWALDGYIIFEYMLPLERYRRPDIILLLEKKVVILEFKQKEIVPLEDIMQAIGYREDIKNYHHITNEFEMDVESFVVSTRGNNPYEIRGIEVINDTNFEKIFYGATKVLDEDKSIQWIKSIYKPIPSIMESAHELFFKGELPYIKNISEGELEESFKKVNEIIDSNTSSKKLILVSGVAGSGKTLIALRTLYEKNKKALEKEKMPSSIYLSGNGPLISVLREELSAAENNIGKTYIKEMLEFKREYKNCERVPYNTVFLFDEAQRAWDSSRTNGLTEAQIMVEVCERVYEKHGFVNLVCFVGDGQSIHTGEEQGIKLWNDAIKDKMNWKICIPQKYSTEFCENVNVDIVNELFLDTSIRSRFLDATNWIEGVLNLNIELCKKELEDLQKKGFGIKMTRDYESLKIYCEALDKNKNYGLIISSKNKEIEKKFKEKKFLSNYRSSYLKAEDAGKWFLSECKDLKVAASEFTCQGLEIDYPIVVFSGDIYIKKNNEKYKWMYPKEVSQSLNRTYSKPREILFNTYRVLLSRAREETILFIPRSEGFNETYNFFHECGVDEIRI